MGGGGGNMCICIIGAYAFAKGEGTHCTKSGYFM